MIARIEYFLLHLTLIFAIFTLILLILLVATITSQQFKPHSSSFFTIYAFGFIYNAVSLLTLNVGGTAASLGWLPASYTRTNVTVQVFFFFTYFARCGEVITTVLVALNRMTAIFLPLRHKQIWSRRSLLLCLSYQFLMGNIMGVMVVITRDFSWVHAADGASFPKLPQSKSATLLMYGILAFSLAFIPVVVLLYAFSYYKLRNSLRMRSGAVQKFNGLSISHAPLSGQSDERAWEMKRMRVSIKESQISNAHYHTWQLQLVAYYLSFAYVFVIAKDFEKNPLAFHSILIIQGCANSGIPTYLLVIFSLPVRMALKNSYFKLMVGNAVSTGMVSSDAVSR